MSTFEAAIGPLLKNEGPGFVGDDNHRGASKWGVTLATFRQFHPEATSADIAALGPEQATAFYRMAFWEKCHMALIEDQELATKLLDLTVNVGDPEGIILLQRAVGVHPDGILGPSTAAAVNSQPPLQVMAALRAQAKQHYDEAYQFLLKKHPDWADKLAKQHQQWLARLAK